MEPPKQGVARADVVLIAGGKVNSPVMLLFLGVLTR